MNTSKDRDYVAYAHGTELDSSKKLTSKPGDQFPDLAGQGDSNPSQTSDHTHSESPSLAGEGTLRRRDWRQMNRDEHRRGGPSQRRGSHGRQDHYSRPREDQGWGRNRDMNDRYYNGNGGSPRRGHFRGPEPQRSRSPVGRSQYSRSPSNGGSAGNRNSLSRSRSRSRSLGRNDGRNIASRSNGQSGRSSRLGREWGRRGHHEPDGRHRGADRYTSSRRSCSSSSNSNADTPTSSSSEDEDADGKMDESTFSKDQRTVFVSQLVMRATEKDIRRYFRRKVGCKVNEVILLRDKRTGNHKGGAYIEMGRIEDVNKAVAVTGQPPDFQRFPILVKASEAEKNYVIPASSAVVTATMMGASSSPAPFLTTDGRVVESQKVYVGGLDPNVSEEHLFALFSQFGELEKVTMQMDPGTQVRRGFAFLSFKDPKVANLAIQIMSNKPLAARPMKTGWASHPSSIAGVEIVTSEEFPEDASMRTQKAFAVLAQLTGATTAPVVPASSASFLATIESAVEKPVGVSLTTPTAELVIPSSAGNMQNEVQAAGANVATAGSESVTGPELLQGKTTKCILVHNMFDKDTETESGWDEELQEEFKEECGKFGQIVAVTIISDQPGGKIYASFETLEAARLCANNLSGRWFDKRKLRVEYVDESSFPKK